MIIHLLKLTKKTYYKVKEMNENVSSDQLFMVQGLILGAGLSLQLDYHSSCSKMDLPFIHPGSSKEGLTENL